MKKFWPLLLMATISLAEAEQWTRHESVFGRWHGEPDEAAAPQATGNTALPVGIVPLRDGAMVTIDVLTARERLASRKVPTRTVYYERIVPAWDGGAFADASGGMLDAGIHIARSEEEVPLTRWEQAKKLARERPVMTTIGLVATGFAIHWAGDKYIWGGDGGGSEPNRPNAETNAGENSNNITVIGDGNTVTVTTNDGSLNPSGAGN